MSILLGGRPALDALVTARACADLDFPTDWLDRANTFAVGTGGEPGRGAVLMRRGDLDQLALTGDLELAFLSTAAAPTTFLKVTVLGAACVLPGAKGDGQAPYLCEVADRRYHLAKVPVNAAYNVRSALTGSYLANTLNAGVAWTWAQVVADLWAALGAGSTPALPFIPDATPENLSYWGGWAWAALSDVLARIGCAVRYWPPEDVFTFVRLGAADAPADAEATRLEGAGARTWDADPLDPARAWRPEKVRVRFVRSPLPTDGTSPYYVADVTLAAATGVVSGSFVQLDDDLSALGATGTPTNAAACATRASERAADWLRKRSVADKPALVVYRDVQPKTGVLLSSTRGQVAFDDRAGQRTAVKSAPDGALERWGPLARLPRWWPPAAGAGFWARVTGGDESGYSWTRVEQTAAGTWGDSSPTASGSTNAFRPPSSTGIPPVIPTGQRVWLMASPTVAGKYEIAPTAWADAILMGKLDGTLSYGGSATLSVWAWNGSADADTGVNVTVYDWLLASGQTVASGTQVVAAYVGGRYRVIGAQCG